MRIASTPTHDANSDNTDETYQRGDQIKVELTFSEAVTVDASRGRPRLKIDLHEDAWGEKRGGLRERQRLDEARLRLHGGARKHVE